MCAYGYYYRAAVTLMREVIIPPSQPSAEVHACYDRFGETRTHIHRGGHRIDYALLIRPLYTPQDQVPGVFASEIAPLGHSKP